MDLTLFVHFFFTWKIHIPHQNPSAHNKQECNHNCAFTGAIPFDSQPGMAFIGRKRVHADAIGGASGSSLIGKSDPKYQKK